MRHFLFEEKEYRIRADFRRQRKSRDSALELARLLRRKSAGRGSGGGGGGYGRRAAGARQKCVAKMQYSSSLAAHKVQLEKYLAREGTDIDGSAAKLFGTDTGEYRNTMTAKHFRVFLSPQSPNVDLKTLTERFVHKLELQTGYRFFWQGACHYNTAHPHAHLLLNGVDRNGKEINIPRDVVKTFMRETARDLCTAQLGMRTTGDLAIEREQELSARRFTALDNRILERCFGTFRLDLSGTVKEKDRMLARIETLCKLKLCSYENGAYRFKAGWENDLKANGRYNAFLNAREALRYSAPSALKVYSGLMGEVTGKVTKVYRLDGDASDNHAVVLEGLDGRAYFVPLFKAPELREGGEKTALKEGELITLKTYESQKGRLTPLLFKEDGRRLIKMISRGAYAGKLAREIMTGTTEVTHGKRKI
jgi:hypothetical protein